MSTFEFTGPNALRDAARQIARDARARQIRVKASVKKAADRTATAIKRDMAPKAFGFLAESIVSHGGDPGAAEVSCESDYAEAVELGTRGAPRKAPPLDKIIAWVQLRGIQGLSAKGNLIRLPRSVKVFRNQVSRGRYHARTVAAEIRNQVGGSEGAAAWRAHTMNDSGVLPATLAVARAIQMKIKNVGTKPRRFMLNSIPIAEAFLDYYVKQALTDNYQYV